MAEVLTVRSGRTIDPEIKYQPQSAVITDLEKRRGTSKYYIYIIEVTTYGNLKYNVFRRFAQFFEMYNNLSESCTPELAKTIPLLPPKIYFGRSAVREVANQRMPLLNDFISRILQITDLAKKCCVRDFFTQSIGDGKPYEFQNPILKSPLPQRKRSQDQNEKTPSIFPIFKLPRNNPHMSAPKSGPRALVLFDYSARDQEELTLVIGKTVELIRQINTFWLEGKYLGKQGIFPANYVRIIEPLDKYMDEFDFSDEWDDDEEDTFFTVFYKGMPRQIVIDPLKANKPSYDELISSVRAKLKLTEIVLNFIDKDGDLIAILDDDDIRIMVSESFYVGNSSNYRSTTWALHVTKKEDYSQYNIDPFSK